MYLKYVLMGYSVNNMYRERFKVFFESRKNSNRLKVQPERISHIEELSFFNKLQNLKLMESKM